MSLPVPTRTAAWALPYVLGMATLVVGCSKTERPEVAIRQTTLAAQTPGATALGTWEPLPRDKNRG